MSKFINTDSTSTTRYFKDPDYKILHRIDGPAVIFTNGDKIWYINGKIHRNDGPAIEFTDGTQEWYQNGELHNENGPAIVWRNGDTMWFKNGNRHRVDGYAAQLDSISVRYWAINGKQSFLEQDYKQALAKWVSYREVTTEDIKRAIGDYRIVEW